MRIAAVESQYGRPDPQGRIPHAVSLHEEWSSLDEAIKDTGARLSESGLTWTARKLGPEMAEIDVHDPPTETLIGLFDADALEKKTGTPIMDLLRFNIEKKAMMETIAAEMPDFKQRQGALGIRKVGDGPSRYQWSGDYTDIERQIKARRVIRGVMARPDGKATRVRIWDAVLGLKGDPRPVMVWDGEDGPVAPEHIGLGRRAGAIQKVPPGMLFISWRRLHKAVTQLGRECLVGDPL